MNVIKAAGRSLSGKLMLLVFLIGCVANSASFSIAAEQTGQSNETLGDKPNVVFIFADDYCFQQLGSMGCEEIETPNLDRLARQGATFTHAYNMGSWSGAVCVASRTMLNTGRFVWQANKVYNTAEEERQAGRFWSEILKNGGYETYMTGKWHVKANAQKAFDNVKHVRPGMPRDTKIAYNRPLADQPDPWSPFDTSQGGYWQGGKHWSEVVRDDALEFIDQAAQSEDPFFMYLAFNAPHDPRQSPESYINRYPLDKISVPVNYQAEYPYKDLIGCGPGLRDEKLAPFPRTEFAVQKHRQEYYAIITHLDEQIGQILDALESKINLDNTYIVFTADHGLAVGQHGLVGKQNMYDHSVRVPMLIVGPGIESGRRIDTPIYLQDVMPTTLDWAGIDKPDHVDFKSLKPVLDGNEGVHYESIYGAYLKLQRMITFDGYKLIVYPDAKVVRLYHVAEDPHELHDLAQATDQQDRVRDLFQRLVKLQSDLEDDLDLKGTFPELAGETPVPQSGN